MTLGTYCMRAAGIILCSIVFVGCGKSGNSSVTPIITVTLPDGGETWNAGSTQSVTWTSTNVAGTVDIAYSMNNGINWTDIAIGEANDGTYSWNVPAPRSNQCLFRVGATAGTPTDISDATFTIADPSITVTSPDGGEIWVSGTTQEITWTSVDVAEAVDIAYSSDNGVNWIDIATGELDDGLCSWVVPPVASAQCLLRVRGSSSSPSDVSDSLFTLVIPSITVTSPNGAETWISGTFQTISWTTVGVADTLDLAYSTDNGANWTNISTGEVDDGTRVWLVPAIDSNQCLIRAKASSGSLEDTSDAVFTMVIPGITVTSPNGAETWDAQTTQSITWTSKGISGTVDVAYSLNGGTNWTDIATGEANDGTLDWALPAVQSTLCLIRVRDSGGTPYDISDAIFAIWDGCWMVDADAGSGGDGRSWVEAFQNPQEALAVAQAGDEIWVAEGTYKPTSGTDRTVFFTMKTDVSVYGGFYGNEVSRSQRNWTTRVTILSGDIGTQSDNSDNSYHVVVGANSATLDGFTIQYGNANGPAEYSVGGGMSNVSASPVVANCVFTQNTASWGGGGMYNENSAPAVTGCIFSSNSGPNYGGGMYNYTFGSPILTKCIFSGNIAYYGGGMFNFNQCYPNVLQCVFKGNTATGDGGGMMNYTTCSPTVTNCVFTGNAATLYNGGGMYNDSSSPVLKNCTFTENTAGLYGAGMTNNFNSFPTVTNCIFWHDVAVASTELYNNGSVVVISFSNVWMCGGSGAGWLSMYGSDGGGNIDSDPLFANSADTDGADNTWFTVDDGLYLQTGSPCIDAGNGDSASVIDILGNSRYDNPAVVDSGTGTPTYTDIGAYERQP